MKWLEIIDLRSVGNKRARIESQLRGLIDEVIQETRPQAIKVYSHITVGTDFSVHLYKCSISKDINKSSLGQRPASTLKEVGFVGHSVWVEK